MANILAVAATAATSSDVVLADGSTANLVLIVASGEPDPGCEGIVYLESSGADIEVARINYKNRAVKVLGPGTFKVYRSGGFTFGVDSV